MFGTYKYPQFKVSKREYVGSYLKPEQEAEPGIVRIWSSFKGRAYTKGALKSLNGTAVVNGTKPGYRDLLRRRMNLMYEIFCGVKKEHGHFVCFLFAVKCFVMNLDCKETTPDKRSFDTFIS